jgi:cytochrome c
MTKAKLLGLALAMTVSFSGAAWAQADAAAGEKVFKKCKYCHTLDEGGKNRPGPNLWGIFGRQAGTVEGFMKKYSDDMIAAGEAGLVWSEEALASYLMKEGGNKVFIGGFIDKNKAKINMRFGGLKKEEDAANIVAYIKENTQ